MSENSRCQPNYNYLESFIFFEFWMKFFLSLGHNLNQRGQTYDTYRAKNSKILIEQLHEFLASKLFIGLFYFFDFKGHIMENI